MYRGTGKVKLQILRRVDLNKQQLCQRVLLLAGRVAQSRGKVPLRIVVDQQDFLACGIEGSTEIQRGRGLPYAALKIGNCNNHDSVLLVIT